MFTRKPILPGNSDIDQLEKIWQLCGTPNQHTWPDYDALPGCEGVKRFSGSYPRRVKHVYDMFVIGFDPRLCLTSSNRLGKETCDLLDKLLTCNPRERITAAEALDHDYFWTDPLPADPKKWELLNICRVAFQNLILIVYFSLFSASLLVPNSDVLFVWISFLFSAGCLFMKHRTNSTNVGEGIRLLLPLPRGRAT
jgi:serine/threonine protein kinase